MLTLNNSQKLRNEIAEFEQRIQKIKFEDKKNKASKLLSQLREQVMLINEGHASNNDGNIDPHTLRENVMKLSDLRRDLTAFLQHVK